MEKKLLKPYLTDYSLLTVQDFWQAHSQILLIILLKKFIKLNVKINMILKKMKLVELNTNIAMAIASMNTQTL